MRAYYGRLTGRNRVPNDDRPIEDVSGHRRGTSDHLVCGVTDLDLEFTVSATWAGVNTDGEGEMHIGDHRFRFSAPANMGGKGVGSSPEDLLLAAVTACYSGTLMRVLSQSHLSAASVVLQTDGVVEGFPTNTRFARITVNPTIKGGDPERQAEYKEAAERARDRCFIGRTVRDYLEYAVGHVTVE